jgi:hypothetical protein
MGSHIHGCVEHALREDNAGVFGNVPKRAANAANKGADMHLKQAPKAPAAKASQRSRK